MTCIHECPMSTFMAVINIVPEAAHFMGPIMAKYGACSPLTYDG